MGRKIGIAFAFKKGLIGCGEFKRDERRARKIQIGKGFATTGDRVIQKLSVKHTYGAVIRKGT